MSDIQYTPNHTLSVDADYLTADGFSASVVVGAAVGTVAGIGVAVATGAPEAAPLLAGQGAVMGAFSGPAVANRLIVAGATTNDALLSISNTYALLAGQGPAENNASKVDNNTTK